MYISIGTELWKTLPRQPSLLKALILQAVSSVFGQLGLARGMAARAQGSSEGSSPTPSAEEQAQQREAERKEREAKLTLLRERKAKLLEAKERAAKQVAKEHEANLEDGKMRGIRGVALVEHAAKLAEEKMRARLAAA